MLIPRQQHSNGSKISVKNFNDSGLEVKPIYKKMAQHNHINKLLSTAAAGNGVIGDVDALSPAPIHDTRCANQQQQHQQQQQQNNSNSSKERTERNLWRNDEVMEMLYVMQQVKALEKLNDKTVKSENVFKDVEVIMHKNGFLKKSHVQIWTKWKFLKSTYMTSRRNGLIPRVIPQEIYEVLHQMITSLNQGLSECGNSTTGSLDGDNSNAGGGGGGMTGNGVEGPNSLANNTEDDATFGMAHPIFGFRLGIVKNEPNDTGYDAVENNEAPPVIEPPQKVVEKPAKKEKPPAPKESPVKKNLEIPHRGRGRPPKNPPAATSTPNSTPSAVARPNAQMPPLRVAPFAKAGNTTNSLTTAAASRPPPPLTMPPAPRPIRLTNPANLSEPIKNGSSEKFSQPKLLPKPAPIQTQVPQPIRLPKEISVNPSRASSTPSPSYPKLKQIPMRKTPYSLRPDRVIPDLDESFSPPPPPAAAATAMGEKPVRFEEVPSTSHLILQSKLDHVPHQNGISRKRRLDWQPANAGQVTFKRIPSDDEEIPATAEQHTRPKDDNNYGKVLQNVVVDLSTSLRKVQTQMMREFFTKQQELLQKEHEFQMQQDRLIMETFQMQTFEIMNSVKTLVGAIANDRRVEEERRYHREAKRRKLYNRHKQRRHMVQCEEEQQQEQEQDQVYQQQKELYMEEQQEQQEIENYNDVEPQQNGHQQIDQQMEGVYSDEDEMQPQNPDHDFHNRNPNEHHMEAEEEEEQEEGTADVYNENHLNPQEHEQYQDEDVQSQRQQESQDDEEEDDDDDEEEDDDDDSDSDSDSDDDDDDNEEDDNEQQRHEMANGNCSPHNRRISSD